MSPKRGGASEIVGDDVRPRDAPVIEQRGEYPALHAERYVLLRPHFRAAIAEQIVVKDLAVPCNVRRDAAPDRAGRYEGGAERQEGEGLRGTRRADELRKESQEEQRDFGIEHVGEDPLTERGPRPGACRCRVELGSCCRPALREQQSPSEEDQVGGSA